MAYSSGTRQRHGTKRKANDENTPPSSDTTARPRKRAEPSEEDFSSLEFKKCLFFYLVDRYRAVPENWKGFSDDTLETHGTCAHPDKPEFMTFQSWAARRLTMLALERADMAKALILVCLDYVDTIQSLMRKMAIGHALVNERYRSIIHFEFLNGYLQSVDMCYEKGMRTTMRIPRIWAAPILAHAKYHEPNTFLCGTGAIISRDMQVFNDQPDRLYIACNRRQWSSSRASKHVENLPLSIVFTGFVPLWGTDTNVPAPGLYTGISERLVELLRSVEPIEHSARELAYAYAQRRFEIGLDISPWDGTPHLSLQPSLCPELSETSLYRGSMRCMETCTWHQDGEAEE
jgi:hypothetical protein